MQEITPSKNKTERRRFLRLNVSVCVEYSILGEEEVKSDFTHDIGGGGICLIVYDNIIEENTILKLSIHLPDDTKPIKALGRVVWQRAIPSTVLRYDLGIEFIEISPEDRQRISEYVINHINKS
ncbi:MAG: PilZ domain-containing protein [Candidatus Omnitrophica bacterium]|nr:PilZ domain-containing protein [Candidatus Omnitrophota bacterium]MCM8827584.1 PilZ domain-containing protein [Candidatus Omnitrophota bacterium]